MYYLIGRDLDADGQYEFIQDMDNMILTENANRALQVTENELDYIDMAYLNAAGFYAMEADRFQVSLLETLLFHPVVRGYRPRVAPPPRRAPRRRAPGLGILGALFAPRRPAPRRKPVPKPPKPPRARRAAPPPPPARPAPGGRAAAPARPAPGRSAGPARPAPGGRSASPARPGTGAGRRGPGGRGPGGRGFGR